MGLQTLVLLPDGKVDLMLCGSQEFIVVVLFVHGLCLSPLSGWPVLHALRRTGIKTCTFGYLAAWESFESIASRLTARITQLSAQGDYVVVGHSLGGVLLRAALSELPVGTELPKHAFLLGSPARPSRLAVWLKKNFLFRMITGDCGQLLGSVERMSLIGPIAVPTTSIIGVRGIHSRYGPFIDEPNDGIVSVSEVSATWVSNQIEVPVYHTFLPASQSVAKIIQQTLTDAST